MQAYRQLLLNDICMQNDDLLLSKNVITEEWASEAS